MARGFAYPTHAAAAPGEPGYLYVVERNGRVRALDLRTGKRHTFLDIRRRVATGGLRGFFSIAFHPRYERNRRFFVDYSGRDGDLYVVEYRSNGRRARPTRHRVVLHLDVQPGRYRHYGGQLAFGPDGRLYVGIGDGGVAGSAKESPAQDPSSLFGKVLRFDVDSERSPRETVAYGLRNPWRFSFDRATGDIYIGDVGAERWEEIDVVHRSDGLVNFGWDVYEGRRRIRARDVDPTGLLRFPRTMYRRTRTNCSVIGGFVYRGRALPTQRGRYFYGDLCSGRVMSLSASGNRREPLETDGVLTSFAEDTRGELYVLSAGGKSDGTVYRVSR